jgi:phage/conjugal plasmid C-4 type zinc finger TraR family protein
MNPLAGDCLAGRIGQREACRIGDDWCLRSTFTLRVLSLYAYPDREQAVATGWAGDNAVQDQIDATIKDGIKRVRSQLPQGPGLTHCEECENEIPLARREVVPGVRLCVACQEAHDVEQAAYAGYNRRGSKDSQLR